MIIREKVKNAIENQKPVVALESTVIAQGLPYPHNVEMAEKMIETVEQNGAVAATIGILKGKIIVGMDMNDVNAMLADKPLKVGVREIPYATGLGKSAATTVSATMRIASEAGIKVFATGGIGGVHRGEWDVSQDIFEMAQTSMIIISAGCKAILDVKKTIEFLETYSILTLGYKTSTFPTFYSNSSSYKLEHRVDSCEEIAKIFTDKEKLSIKSAIFVANPINKEDEISNEEVEKYIKVALKESIDKNISGKAVTPYLLSRLGELSNGKTLTANKKLLINNAILAARIANKVYK